MNDKERKETETIIYERIRFLSVLESIPAFVYLQASDYSIPFANQKFMELFGNPEGRDCYAVIHGRETPCNPCPTFRIFETQKPCQWEWTLPDGRIYIIYNNLLSDMDTSRLIIKMGIDITERRHAENALQKAHDELEKRVKERTFELAESNKELIAEITERKQAEKTLRIKTLHLEEAKTTLEVLLERRNKDKTELEEKVLFNIKELIVPYIEKLERSGLNDLQSSYLKIIESILNDISSPLVRRLSPALKLTPSEIQVANLVKQGKTTRKIADMLNLSSRTVEFHRYNLRKKIGIKSKKINLRTYLLSIK